MMSFPRTGLFIIAKSASRSLMFIKVVILQFRAFSHRSLTPGMESFLSSILTELILVTVKCAENETFYACGPCDSICGAEIACASLCQPFGGCGCMEGYVRNDTKICIPRSECPHMSSAEESQPLNSTSFNSTSVDDSFKWVSCPEFEFYSKIGMCERTCEKPSKRCYRVERKPGCRCVPGYVRNTAINQCVPLTSCVNAIFK
ncbi:hypothetical protein L596_012919 [Steinernema carpocapsae]|uniref:TIL domain-containing protein n=1 Tax=Steinernema carpocapsae TaxID=34508 RepID=A0A4U5NYN5_STECR|nr:hypothetical protein L596_012919 [Steinernema carpocapsae]